MMTFNKLKGLLPKATEDAYVFFMAAAAILILFGVALTFLAIAVLICAEMWVNWFWFFAYVGSAVELYVVIWIVCFVVLILRTWVESRLEGAS